MAGVGSVGRVVQESGEGGSNAVWGELTWGQKIAGFEAAQAVRVVGLIMGHGHDQLGHPSGEALAEGADAAMMHKSGRPTQQRTEGGIGFGVDRGRQIPGDLGEVPSDEDACAIDLLQGGGGGAEEGRRLNIGAAGGEDNGRMIVVAVEKGLQPGRQRIFGGEIFQREEGLKVRAGPVGLWRRIPLWKQQQRAVWGIPPVIEETFRR